MMSKLKKLNTDSVLVGISHQRKRGKYGVNPALSRNCKKVWVYVKLLSPLSQDARRSLNSSAVSVCCSNLRGTGYVFLLFGFSFYPILWVFTTAIWFDWSDGILCCFSIFCIGFTAWILRNGNETRQPIGSGSMVPFPRYSPSILRERVATQAQNDRKTLVLKGLKNKRCIARSSRTG